MEKILEQIKSSFKQNVESVYELMDFDRLVLDFAIQHVSALEDKLKKIHGIDNPHLSAANTLQMLKNVRAHDSMRPYYDTIFNQCLVLLVSHFGSTIRDLFVQSITVAARNDVLAEVSTEEIKITIAELQSVDYNLSDRFGEIMAAQKDISFQDMQSINRAFEKYFKCSMERDKHVNNIILGQACRHSIVHSGALVDQKLANQVAGAVPRDIKVDIMLNDKLLFLPSEIRIIANSMSMYLHKLIDNLSERLSKREEKKITREL